MPTRAHGLAAALIAVLMLAACGDDDEPATATADSDDRSAYCDAAFAWNTPPDPEDHEFDQDWVDTVLRPRFEELEAHAPEAIADDVTAIAAALDGGDEAAGQAADLRIARFSAEECDWHVAAVTTVEYAFEGAPATVPAGVVAFDVTNDGDEPHMVKIVRRADDVATPVAELLGLPEAEQDQALESFEPEDFIEPAGQAMTVADLRPGDYALVCDLPVGTTDLFDDDIDSDAATHAAEGMVHEFTVR